MSDALSLSMLTAPSEARAIPSAAANMRAQAPITQTIPKIPSRLPPGTVLPPAQPTLPRTTPERMLVARERIRTAAEAGQRIRSYEVALDLDLSEFHFARQFRAAFGRSPHVYYDEVRATKARELLQDGMSEGDVARRIGFRRPAELRSLLAKR
ncbi:helix-turn-helix domain-containing protein [Polyangium aurulentum]|uniref:helix-turn-helix domain-containing protein n=1 Tax=Polyangium aurulentum TaxID=2567896 RepID=UPI0010AE4416|nr:helix-turn-helix domain-containing protein [Polyangium aurulentum]UQA55891.1 helix-turn-helix domain-containing protein [Polyangium aurulentum]